MLNKQAHKFINRKDVKKHLISKELTSFHIVRLNKLFSKFTCKELENMHETIAKFVLYDLNNYEGRIRRLRGIPGTTKYTQLLRYGKLEYNAIITAQAERKTKHFTNKLSTWIDKGYDIISAKEQVSLIQTTRSNLSPVTQKGASEYSVRCVGYWLKKGLTEEEARTAVGDTQRRHHSTERNIRWQQTLQAKSEEEKQLINLKKGHSVEANIARGMDEDSAIIASNAYWQRRNNYSKSSQVFFGILDSLLQSDTVYYKIKNYEKQFNRKYVDFYDASSGVVIEYYGDFWHRNPKTYHTDFVAYGITSGGVWKRDDERIQIIETHADVNKVLIVWESEINLNPHLIAEKLIEEMKKCHKK